MKKFLKRKQKLYHLGNSIHSGFLIYYSNLILLLNQILASLMLNSRFPLKSNFRSDSEADHSDNTLKWMRKCAKIAECCVFDHEMQGAFVVKNEIGFENSQYGHVYS